MKISPKSMKIIASILLMILVICIVFWFLDTRHIPKHSLVFNKNISLETLNEIVSKYYIAKTTLLGAFATVTGKHYSHWAICIELESGKRFILSSSKKQFTTIHEISDRWKILSEEYKPLKKITMLDTAYKFHDLVSKTNYMTLSFNCQFVVTHFIELYSKSESPKRKSGFKFMKAALSDVLKETKSIMVF